MIDRDKPCYLTPSGKRALEQELEELRTVRRPALAASIRHMTGFGGFNETGELDEFMNEQAQIDAHIKDLEFVLRHAIMVDDSSGADRVGIGRRVTLLDGGEEILWTIVSSAEASPRQGKISSDSLVGSALMGHHVGDTVTVNAPAGPQEFVILKIE